ncbi:MAG: M23 family metallopeptidase [Alphaproteobacteria bacterium]|nr:M23 family metallopeptidase [Alphaproteobacteria bacterium]
MGTGFFKQRLLQLVLVGVLAALTGCAREEPPADVVMSPSTNPYHIVARGETLSVIAKQYGMEKAALIRINRLKPPYKIFIGQKLIVSAKKAPGAPSKPSVKPVTSVADSGDVSVEELPAEEGKDKAGPAMLPTMGSGIPGSPTSVAGGLGNAAGAGVGAASGALETVTVGAPGAAAETVEQPQKPAAPASTGQLQWPVQGQVIKSFGVDQKGQRNDGINIAVPAGTAVKAVDNGVVAHVGNQHRGFGNLVLVKHAGGKISVYGHLKEASVKVGDSITVGQQVGTAGTSGGVSEPQVHFELRQGKTALNPVDHLK